MRKIAQYAAAASTAAFGLLLAAHAYADWYVSHALSIG
jgi:hypothetical protein